MSTISCPKCGRRIEKENIYCPKCGTPTQSIEQAVPAAKNGGAMSSHKSWGGGKVIIIGLLIILILIVPVFPRDRVIYVDGVTQTVTMSTAYNSVLQPFSTPTQTQVTVYQGTLRYVSDQYYNQNYQSYYGYSNYYPPSCYRVWYGYFHYYFSCSYYYPNSYNPSYYSPYNYASTVTIGPTNGIVRVQQSQESNGYSTFILTHYDGTSDTYRHVFQQDLTPSGTLTIPVQNTATTTITTSSVSTVTAVVQCQQCVMQHVTEHVSLLQLLLGM